MHDVSTIVCIGTGASLTHEQINTARAKGFRLFGCNVVFRIVPDLELTYGCNENFWRMYWNEIKFHPCEKWTTNKAAAFHYGIRWIDEREGDGLCTTPGVIHHGHGSGYSLVSMAHKAGAKRIILIGYDLAYAPDYDGLQRKPGSTPRHSTLLLRDGEYPEDLQHWPSVQVKDGKHIELVRLYGSVRDQGFCQLVNATPGSALESTLGFTPIDEC